MNGTIISDEIVGGGISSVPLSPVGVDLVKLTIDLEAVVVAELLLDPVCET